MNFRDLRSKIEHLHSSDPSRQHLLDSALRAIEDALGTLARHGHHFHLEEGHLPAQAFPRTVYHFSQGAREVRSEWQLADLGEGWYDSPRDAAMREGLDAQFAGRGGLRRSNLPVLVEDEGVEDRMKGWKEYVKRQFLKERASDGNE